MEGRGGCCIARYGRGGGGYKYNDMSKVDLIMLKYRPIAPKPAAAGGGLSGRSVPESTDLNLKGRTKKRYVRDNRTSNRRCGMRRRKASPEKASSGGSSDTVVTLPLLSETPERKESPVKSSKKAPIWLNFGRKEIMSGGDGAVAFGVGGGEAMVSQPVRLVESCVTVECVTETWMVGNSLGRTDEEKVMNLYSDSCPGFVSDGYNRVNWTNKAYKEMVGQVNGEEIMVWLVMKDLILLPLMSDAFTCRVKVTCRKDKVCALTLPCDVWRLSCGGFAWRLDINAALCLGR